MMTSVSQPDRINLHATAITLAGKGLLFIGPSGSGKSATAFACIVAARRQSLPATLVADDQVLIERQADRLLAFRPTSIAGLLELRGSGIVEMESVESAPLDLVVKMVSGSGEERLPPEDRWFRIDDFGCLPMVHITASMPEPLAVLGMLSPLLREFSPFPQTREPHFLT